MGLGERAVALPSAVYMIQVCTVDAAVDTAIEEIASYL